MNKIKNIILLLIPVFATLNAQNNIGIDYYNVKDYELAKKYFLQKLSETPEEANYYLGEIAFAEGDLEKAINYYSQGLQTSFDSYSRIGLAKVDLKKGQKTEALSSLNSIQRRFPRDMNILIAIGYAYLDNQLNQNLQSHLRELQKIDKKNPKIYVLEGDLLKSEDKIGQAAAKYDMAIYFDANYALAYIKGAEVYERSSPQVAIEKLRELIERNPNYTLAYRYLGRIYTSNGYYSSAIDAFKTYFAAGNYTLDDIARYATALYFSKDYEEAYKMIKEGLAINPDHFVLNRLQMYVIANTLNSEISNTFDSEAGLDYAKRFFSLKKDQTSEYIWLDYSMYALILKDLKMFDEALEQYKQVLLLDNTAVDVYKEMATIVAQKGQSDLAADYYKSYIEKGGDKIDVLDYFQLGRYYYSAANVRSTTDTASLLNRLQESHFVATISENELQKDSLIKNPSLFITKAIQYYLNQTDKAFDMVIELVPEGYTGYLWKARTNSLMDPDSEIGLAKPHYEKTVEILSDKEEVTPAIRNALIEAYSYLGYFYYLKEDKTNTLHYWGKVLELDPNNNNANAVLKSVK